MKQLTTALLFIVICLFSMRSNGEEISVSFCQEMQSPQDVLNCAKKNHADIQLGKAFLKESELGIKVAKQRPNPELELEGLDNGGGNFSNELTLLHTFEVGGKRKARKSLALAEKELSQTNLLEAKENVIIEVVLNLYRLRQLQHELEVIRENLATFRKVKSQYENIGRLTPEQEFSVSIFQIAEEENKLRIEQLKDEENQILSWLHLATNETFSISQKILPKRRSKWPSVPLSENQLAGSHMKKLHNNIAVSKSKYQLEKSNSWPDISIGPKAALTHGNNDDAKFGFGLSVPLPLYQRNGAGRAKALTGLKSSELQAKLKTKQLQSHRNNLVQAYESITKAILRSQSKTALSNRHAKLHQLLDKGIVSAPLIIELHREILEYYERLHEQELRAVNALWKIYALDGTILAKELR